jgi:hypothetical protein
MSVRARQALLQLRSSRASVPRSSARAQVFAYPSRHAIARQARRAHGHRQSRNSTARYGRRWRCVVR